MRQNENLVLIGPKAILVPYKPEHVPVYHEWMKSPFLQEMTASEPLTLQEEYDMQQSWHLDDNTIPPPGTTSDQLKDGALSGMGAVMIGDVNLFFNDPDNDKSFAEIEIMIAEEDYRKRGYGIEAINMMMAYELGVTTFEAKISLKNQPSVHMFRTKLGFRERSVSTIFEEVTLDWISSTAPCRDSGEELSVPTKEEMDDMHLAEKQLLTFWKDRVCSTSWKTS